MMRVFTLAMSMPVSMMVVQTSMSTSPSDTRVITSFSSSWPILPWPTAMDTFSPSSSLIRAAVRWMVSTRLWR